MKETYRWYNSVFHGFEVTGSGLVAPPPAPALKLECFGDSNAAGDNIATEDNSSGTGQYFTFPFIAARALGAQMHNLSTSGETISGGHSRYDRYGWWTGDPLWDFGLYTPDVVIVNIGANDVVAKASVTKIKNDYNAFLDDLRTTYPSAHICLMNGFGWDFDETANYTDELINARIALGDSNLSYLHFPWVFGQWHGCEYDHAGMAACLVEHLENVLGITAPNPIDIMDGFGRNGNVANGSFEEITPFGGYGWRYFLDAGVNRVNNPAGAKDGDYYLSLTNNAKSFQTNPADSGDTITVTAWMRGANNGDQADITIDFRDQSMGGYDIAPVIAHTETKTLTTSWAQYSMVATAPTTGNPIFGTRITFTAGSSDTVYIDNIQTFNFSFNLDDLNDMVGDWLSDNAQWDIAPWPEGDDIVNIKDFSLLTDFWEY
jgi:hypothetical protein